MSVSASEEAVDPAGRSTEGTIPLSSTKLTSPKETLVKWDGRALAEAVAKDAAEDCCLLNQSHERISGCETDHIGHGVRGSAHSGSSSISSTSSGSLGDVLIGSNRRRSLNEPSSFLSSMDANLPLEVINPIMDLVEDDNDEDAFGVPLSQQDEKLLEELLRYVKICISKRRKGIPIQIAYMCFSL